MGAAAIAASHATDLLIKDGDTLALNGTTYRLDGIDAPELEAYRAGRCEAADRAHRSGHCGQAARNRGVTCELEGRSSAMLRQTDCEARHGH